MTTMKLIRISAIAAIALTTAATAPAAPINLAPSGTATGSSQAFGSVFADVIDGNRDGAFANGSVWHSADPETSAPTRLEVDLGGDFYLDRIQILPRTDATQHTVENFRLTVFADDGAGNPGATVWTGDFLTGGQAANQAWGTTEPAGVLGRHVRFTRLDQSPNFATFAEFEVWGQATPFGSNIVLGKSVTASPAGFGSAIADGNDNDINGAFTHPEHAPQQGSAGPVYHSATSAIGQFWQVDLGGHFDLDFLQLFARNETAGTTTTQFKLSVLDASLAEVFSTTINNNNANRNLNYDYTVDLTGVVGTYIRVETTLAQFLAFSELRAFGIQVPAPAALPAGALLMLALAARRRRRR